MSSLERYLLLLATLCLGAWGGSTLDEWLFQRDAARRLDALAESGGRMAFAARTKALRSGLVGRIQIPRIGLEAIVAEGIASRTLDRAVGHLSRTAYPGESGNVALAGHRDTHFRRLERLKAGDEVRMVTPDGTFRYEVERILIVDPERADLVAPALPSRLTLVTCYPFRMVGPAPRRFVVIARQVDPPVARVTAS